MHLQDIPNQLLDAFTDTKGVIKSNIPTVNALVWIEIPRGKFKNVVTDEFMTHLKSG